MGMVTRAMKRRLEEAEELVDRISLLPDAILGEIVSLLPTKDGGRTQVLSSRWRYIWRSAPLNINLINWRLIPMREISGILSSHPGPGRRFSIPKFVLNYNDSSVAILDGWLRSPSLDNLQELEFNCGCQYKAIPPPPLPLSVQRFSRTLRVASFSCCDGFPDGDNANTLQLPVLKQLSLSSVIISDSSMRALLAGCPALESLLLYETLGFSCIRIVSPSLISIAVRPGWGELCLKQIIIEDAPSLGRLLLTPCGNYSQMAISVVSAPKLDILGLLSKDLARLQFGTTIFQESRLVSLMMLVPSVKVLALTQIRLSVDVIINFLKCFPCLEKLYIRTIVMGENNVSFRKYQNLIGTLDISLKKIVLINYHGKKSHIAFAKFFVLNAKVLQSMVFEIRPWRMRISSKWIERQHRLLQTKNRASKGAVFDFVNHAEPRPLGYAGTAELAHDLSTADPFVRLKDWSS